MLENPASDGIDVAANNAAYYYHFDGLGSVVALSDSDGDSCQSYEYSAYGQVAASDPNFIANPYMFTGRRFDIETGLYYYRARYYNPHIGRFMQTDPVGYDDGMNWYAYCGNNPVGRVDPSGLLSKHEFLYPGEEGYVEGQLNLSYWIDGERQWVRSFNNLDDFYDWASNDENFTDVWVMSQPGWGLSGGDESIFWSIKALEFMGSFSPIEISIMEDEGWTIFNNSQREEDFGGSANGYRGTTIYWDPEEEFFRAEGAEARHWNNYPALAGLAHEMGHAWDLVYKCETTQKSAIRRENRARYACYRLLPGYVNIWPRPLGGDKDLGRTIKRAWKNYYRTSLIKGKD